MVLVLAALFGGAAWALYMKEAVASPLKKQGNAMYIIAVLTIGAAAHIIGALCYYGHPTDMACFNGWSGRIFSDGLRQFYADDGFHDYPPGYVYIMYILGAVKSFMKLEGGALQLWLKLPAIIADLVMGWLAYKLAKRRFSDDVAAVFAAFLVLNPAAIMDTAIWGQIDSILALLCLLAVYWAAEKKLIPAFFAFAAGILIKPQALFFTPVLIYAVIEEVFLQGGFNKDKLIKYVLGALAAIAAMFILFMPFGSNPIEGISTILKQYTATLGEYEYMTVNAFNVYGAFGKNWAGLNVVSKVIGYGAIVLVVAYSAYVFFKSKNPAKYYMTAFILAFGVYMLAIKMHERYAFPGIFMLLFVLVLVPDIKSFLIYGLFSLSQYFNMAWILFIYNQDINAYFRSPVVAVSSWINILFAVFCVYVIQREYVHYTEPAAAAKGSAKNKYKYKASVSGKKAVKTAAVKKESRGFRLSEAKPRLTKADAIAMAAIIVVYSVVALYNLGNSFAPQNGINLKETGTVTVDLGSEQEIAKTDFFLGSRELNDSRTLDFKYMNSNREVVMDDNHTSGSVFYWTMTDINKKARYIEISTNSTDDQPLELKEVCFLDADGNTIVPDNTEDKTAALFDEQEMLVDAKDFMSETYFDEIYHARTAYEFIHHQSVYEWTHPPLGKVLMGIGILIYGMVPFGWRIVGTIFGIFMIPAIYIFAKRMLKHTWLSVVTCLLFTFDFMHFAQTRIATIDVYVTFFIILMYFFMYNYYKMSFYDTPLKKTLIPLGLSGVFFGFAVASKWTGLYAGAGLAALFFYTLYQRYEEYRYAMQSPKGTTDGISHKKVIDEFRSNTIITLSFCIVMFIVVPALIYTCSYIPYFNTPSGHGIKTIFENANSMYTYHSKTVVNSTHPYSSHWYEWPIMYRPIWYFSNTLDSGLKQGISSFGNPAVWWLGIGAVAYMAALSIMIPLKKRGYFNMNKYVYLGIYALIFAVFCAAAYAAGASNEKLERLFVCMLLYSAVFVGIFALVLLYDDYIKQESNAAALFLLVGYMAELMPWIAVVRTTYIYHYFPCVPFTVLMLGYSIKTFYDNCKNKKAIMYTAFIYAGVAVLLFAMFYPVLSGHPCDYEYAQNWLKWFDSWVLL